VRLQNSTYQRVSPARTVVWFTLAQNVAPGPWQTPERDRGSWVAHFRTCSRFHVCGFASVIRCYVLGAGVFNLFLQATDFWPAVALAPARWWTILHHPPQRLCISDHCDLIFLGSVAELSPAIGYHVPQCPLLPDRGIKLPESWLVATVLVGARPHRVPDVTGDPLVGPTLRSR